MKLSEVAMAAAITVSIAGVSYATLNTKSVTRATTEVAQQVSCRTVDEAIVAYEARHHAAPTRVAQLAPFVKGDISAYRITDGRTTGPGC
ncbi:hypothetical protein [Couchioplanes caeruleus]|uniref:Uncharacterized protein n=2 Tax=Couchioplanes caeruleus TaxID=56438 RepID=A0A1K0FFL1_9ACTN|nr:hypothetical protein [Couchioplanes caeruleus]OJF11520.1 hypothetical protein BG844_25895 [Couchioplanes caeruleus subsp. caeruleus]ROP27733.1 hypothetical protein EDD30_0427 [Couchioplanes caeruleus]